MIKVRLFNYNTCEHLLNFRTDDTLREFYNSSSYAYKNITYLNDSVSLNLREEQLALGIKPTDDLDNSIKIFTALKDIDLVQANDKRLWVTLTHTFFFKYATTRWAINASTSNDAIKDRLHFEGTGLRARNQNSIARLWWSAKITYDESLKDPFELTRLLWEKQDFYQNLIDRKLSTYEGTLHAFLRFYAKNKHLDQKSEMRKLFKGINAYGGVRILSLLNEKDVDNELRRLCIFYKIKCLPTNSS